MDAILVKKSTRKNKKKMAIDSCSRVVHFGHKDYDDFTTHKDPERRRRYYLRFYGNALIEKIRAAEKKKILSCRGTPKSYSTIYLW